MFLLLGCCPGGHLGEYWLPASGMCQLFLEVMLASWQYPFAGLESGETPSFSLVLEGIACVFAES
jgi:hypothetical protein